MTQQPHKILWRNRSRLALTPLVLCWLVIALRVSAATGNSLSDASLVEIKFDQKLNNQVSLDLLFRDDDGKSVRLGDYFGSKPVILDLGYYGCPMLCTLVLNGLVESLQDLKCDIGSQFEVVSVSIDSHETSELASAKKRTYLKRYGRPGAAAGWHFLTGEETAIKKLATQVGFNYAYDPSIKQYAHPSGVIVLTPEGRVARYFFGINYSPKELAAALKQASVHQTGSPITQVILLCFHYSPLKGKYGNLIMTIVRVSGVVTLLGLAGILMLISQRRRKRRLDESTPPDGRAVSARPAARSIQEVHE
jgi:protein SCO1